MSFGAEDQFGGQVQRSNVVFAIDGLAQCGQVRRVLAPERDERSCAPGFVRRVAGHVHVVVEIVHPNGPSYGARETQRRFDTVVLGEHRAKVTEAVIVTMRLAIGRFDCLPNGFGEVGECAFAQATGASCRCDTHPNFFSHC